MPDPDGGDAQAGKAPAEQDPDQPLSLTSGADRNQLPSGPVIAAVRRLARLRHESLREFLGPELFIAYCNAHATGRITLLTLERFCDEILAWHPRMLYGDAYDEAAFRSPDTTQ